MATVGDRLEHRLGHERERALRADDQPPEDLHRLIGVEKRAQPVAGRVLDLELVGDPRRQLGVGADLIADLGQTGGERGGGALEALLGMGRRGVDDGPVGEHEGHRAQRLVGVGVHAATHAARIVGDHAAHAGDVGRGRIGAELACVAGEQTVDVPEHDSGPDPRPAPRVLDPDGGEMAAHVDEHRVALGLSVERRAAGPEGERCARSGHTTP